MCIKTDVIHTVCYSSYYCIYTASKLLKLLLPLFLPLFPGGIAVSIPLPPTPEERGVALLPGSTSSSSLTGGAAVLSDDAKTIKELKEMLTQSMATREKAESTKMVRYKKS